MNNNTVKNFVKLKKSFRYKALDIIVSNLKKNVKNKAKSG